MPDLPLPQSWSECLDLFQVWFDQHAVPGFVSRVEPCMRHRMRHGWRACGGGMLSLRMQSSAFARVAAETYRRVDVKMVLIVIWSHVVFATCRLSPTLRSWHGTKRDAKSRDVPCSVVPPPCSNRYSHMQVLYLSIYWHADLDAKSGCVGTGDASSRSRIAKCMHGCIESLTAQAELARPQPCS
jgi:hypothetical protein